MARDLVQLTAALAAAFEEGALNSTATAFGEVTVGVTVDRYVDTMRALRRQIELSAASISGENHSGKAGPNRRQNPNYLHSWRDDRMHESRAVQKQLVVRNAGTHSLHVQSVNPRDYELTACVRY